jgi:hypothetical protein
MDGVPISYVLGGRAANKQYFFRLQITWSIAGVKNGAENTFTTKQSCGAPSGACW